MKNFLVLLLALPVFLFSSCGPRLQKATSQADTVIVKEIMLDTVMVTEKIEPEIMQKLPVYQAQPTRTYNIKHTILDLAFDMEKEHVLGKAYLDISAYFLPTSSIDLDAVNFDIHGVKLNDEDGHELDYTYDGEILKIILNEELTRNETRRFFIDYTAKPSDGPSGGSAAIMSDKGLYFINARGENPHKPTQIWTQGETQSNSKWFPTFDKPNERTTQEMFITVEDRYQILTNGLKTKSTDNDDGTRTEHWEMKTGTGHAPYLFMLTVGEFAVVEDSWNGMPIQYFVEKEYEKDAANIFPHTKEMLTFFSDILDYPYPWDKYSQVVVRDYISGAMENTTASLFGEFVQKHSNELITSGNDGIVAHEMIHQWFGNLVTCESWSNIVLNEGFANYSEYLWTEHKYGIDEAQILQAQSRSGYYSAAAQSIRPLVDYGYGHREEVFDAHSYNKGGLVLHMLRDYLGDELFYSSLNYYLNRHQFSATEVADLRLAIEKVSGEDMNWFFNQWFHEAGHPVLEISQEYDADESVVTLTIEQKQDPDKSIAIFKLPSNVAIYYSKEEVEMHEIVIDKRKQSFTFDVNQKPTLVALDPTHSLLAVKKQDRTIDELVMIAIVGENVKDRIDAFNDLKYKDTEMFRAIRSSFIQDESWNVRRAAVRQLDYTSKNADQLKEIAAQDKHVMVRLAALSKVRKSSDSTLIEMYQAKIDTSYALEEQLTALEGLYNVDKNMALDIADRYLENSNSDLVASTLGTLYSSENNPKYLPFFRERIKRITGYGIMGIMGDYVNLVVQADAPTVKENIDFLTDEFTMQEGSFINQILIAKGIFDLKNMIGISDKLSEEDKNEIREKASSSLHLLMEKADDERVKGMLQRFL